MSDKRLKLGILGGSEADLHVLAELHKQRDVDIAFVYDRNPSAVALEIAEILRIPAVREAGRVADYLPVDYLVVEERVEFAREIMQRGKAALMTRAEALERFADSKPEAPRVQLERSRPSGHPLEEVLGAFERLFDRTRLLKLLLDLAVEETGASNGSIMMYSHEAAELYIAHATGLSERVIRNTRQKLGEGISGSVAQERKGKLIRESAPYPRERDRTRITSACSVPLVDGDTLLGVLNVSSTKNGRELSVGELQTLEKFAPRMARVLADSLRLQEANMHREELSLRQSLGELTENPGSTTEKFSLLSTLVARITGAETVEVFVSTRSGEWLVLGGSNQRLAGSPEFVRVGRGALARCYLERRAIVLTEPVDPQSGALASSFVFIPLVLTDALGVAMIEFAERHRLDDFLAVRDSVSLELARFVANERRERRLRRELEALAKISDAAPSLHGCRSLQDLSDVVARVLADALDCERVSLRLRANAAQPWTVTHYDAGNRENAAWRDDDAERFAKLEKKKAPYHLSLVDFSTAPSDPGRPGERAR